MSENTAATEDNTKKPKGGLEQLADWKTQLTALAVAPFLGIGFVFDFLLRAKDFPEIASAMWAMFALFSGFYFFATLLLVAVMSAIVLRTDESTIPRTGWRRYLAMWLPRLLAVVAIITPLLVSLHVLDVSFSGFKTYIAPYVKWLRLHAGV